MAGPLRLPGRHLALALGVAAARGLSEEWRAAEPGRWLPGRARPEGFTLSPRDARPVATASARARWRPGRRGAGSPAIAPR